MFILGLVIVIVIIYISYVVYQRIMNQNADGKLSDIFGLKYANTQKKYAALRKTHSNIVDEYTKKGI